MKPLQEENPEPGVPDMNLVLPVKGVMMGREARADTLSQHLWFVFVFVFVLFLTSFLEIWLFFVVGKGGGGRESSCA